MSLDLFGGWSCSKGFRAAVGKQGDTFGLPSDLCASERASLCTLRTPMLMCSGLSQSRSPGSKTTETTSKRKSDQSQMKLRGHGMSLFARKEQLRETCLDMIPLSRNCPRQKIQLIQPLAISWVFYWSENIHTDRNKHDPGWQDMHLYTVIVCLCTHVV